VRLLVFAPIYLLDIGGNLGRSETDSVTLFYVVRPAFLLATSGLRLKKESFTTQNTVPRSTKQMFWLYVFLTSNLKMR
jgi:hypothetical protein